MPDNLTLKFKEELERKGIVATDAQIETFLKTQRQSPKQAPVNLGGSLYNNENPGLPSWYEGAQQGQQQEEGITAGDVTRNLYEGLGLAAWQYADIAAFTIPSAILGTMGIDPVEKYKELTGVEELTATGKVGEVIGQAAGFLKPIKWVTKGTAAVVSKLSSKGSQKVMGKVVDDIAKSIPAVPSIALGIVNNAISAYCHAANPKPSYKLLPISIPSSGC